MPPVIRESAVERYLTQRCRALGVLRYKFVSPGHAGVPDCILVGRNALGVELVCFVEVKRPGGTLRPLQKITLAGIAEHGGLVVTLDSREMVDDFLAATYQGYAGSFRELLTSDVVPGLVRSTGASLPGTPQDQSPTRHRSPLRRQRSGLRPTERDI